MKNTFGRSLCVTLFGESHGSEIGAVLDGIAPGNYYVMAFIDVLLHIIGSGYREGLRVVPIVMAAEIMMGIYFNLSFWYKLIDKTIYGAWFSIAGCAALLIVNFLFVPTYGYWACAWGGFAAYGTTMVLSYLFGQRINPIPYQMKSICGYVLLAGALYAVMYYSNQMIGNQWFRMGVNTLLILVYLSVAVCEMITKTKTKTT